MIDSNQLCPCGSSKTFNDCCFAYIAGTAQAPTAEALMRSRYSAYVSQQTDYIKTSTHPDKRSTLDPDNIRVWATQSEWVGLTIVATEAGQEDDNEGVVEFIAEYKIEGVARKHKETSQFKKHEGNWYYFDGQVVGHTPIRRESPKIGRNDPCPCESGKKYKKCCGSV